MHKSSCEGLGRTCINRIECGPGIYHEVSSYDCNGGCESQARIEILWEKFCSKGTYFTAHNECGEELKIFSLWLKSLLFPHPDILLSGLGELASAGRALEEADFEEIGFDNVLDGFFFFSDDRGKRMESDSASGEGVGEGFEDLAIESVESELVYAERCENLLTRDSIGDIVTDNLIIAENFDETIDDTGSPATLLGDEHVDSWGCDDDSEESKGSRDNSLKIGELVEIKFENIPESIPKRSGDFGELSCRTDESELGDIHLDGCRTRPGSDHNINREVLHRRVEDLLDLRLETMNLVDEEHVSFFEAREERDDIGLFLDRGTARVFEMRIHLRGDNR